MRRWTVRPLRPLLLATLLLAYGLRVFRLDYQELRGDEAFGYFFSLRPLAEIVQTTLDLAEPHPVASYFFQHAWLAAVGHREFALRSLGLLFGVLAVALLFRLGRRLDTSEPAALLAAALLAMSPYAIWHSQDARMYSISLALTIASTWLALEWLQRRRWPWALAYLAVSWLALHTHYFAAFILLAQNLFVLSRGLITPRLRVTAISWLGLQAALFLLYLPWLTAAGPIVAAYQGNGDSPALTALPVRAFSVFSMGESIPANQRLWWAWLAAVLLVWGGLRLYRSGASGRRALWLLALYLATPLLATWWSAQQRPIFDERYLIAAAPPFFLLIGAVLQPADGSAGAPSRSIFGWRSAPLLLVALFLAGAWVSLGRAYADPAYSKTRGWRELATVLARFAHDLPAGSVRFAQNFPDPTLWYYYGGPVEHVVLPPAAHDRAGAQAAVDGMVAAGVERVILPNQPAPNWDDANIAQAALDRAYANIVESQVGGWPVRVYTRPPAQSTPLAADFASGIRLATAAIAPSQLTPGGVLAVHLGWQTAAAVLTGTEKVFVQLLGPDGKVVAQQDLPLIMAGKPEAAERPSSYGILIPEALASGSHRLIAGLYDPSQPGAPRILLQDGSDFVELAEFQVTPAP